MAGIIDGVQEAIGDLGDFQTENHQAAKWHTDGLDAGRQVVDGLDRAEKASEGFSAKAAEVEDLTGDVISSIDGLITQVEETLGKIVLASTLTEESKVPQQEAKDGLERASARYEGFTNGLNQVIGSAGDAQKKAESAWGRLVGIGMEHSTQEGGAGTSMLRETEALSEQTGAYVDGLTRASGSLEGDATFIIDSAKSTLEAINLGEARHDSRTTSLERVKGRLSSVLKTLQQGRETLQAIQVKTSADKEEIIRVHDDIKILRDKTDGVVGVLDAQKEVPSANARLTASAIDNGNRYLARIRKH